MKKQDFQYSITADVPTEEAVEAINNVSGWWAKKVKGDTGALHDVFTVHFGKTFVTFEITFNVIMPKGPLEAALGF